MDWASVSDTLVRLAVATGLGGLVGLERQLHGRWADLRTYMTVSMGAAMFMVAGLGLSGDPRTDATRIIQGIATGVGFIGAGTILKLSEKLEVKGLTTASSVWLAAAVGTASGLAMYELAIAGTLVSLVVLGLLRPFEKRVERLRE